MPKNFETQIFVTYELGKYDLGIIKVWDCDVSGSDRILLCSPKIKIQLPGDLDLKAQMLMSLESEKSRLLADTHMKVKEIQEKINNLLCVEYNPDENKISL